MINQLALLNMLCYINRDGKKSAIERQALELVYATVQLMLNALNFDKKKLLIMDYFLRANF